MLPYNLLLWLNKKAGVDGREKGRTRTSRVRMLRLLVGGLAVLAGLTTLFVLAMIYRPIASTNLGVVLTVAGFFAAALALGGVMTAMWLGHWYLVTPALSEKPLLFSTTLVLVGVLAQLIFAFTAGPSTTHITSTRLRAVSATATRTTTVTGA